ncbi:hypothetical protein ElyMa_004803800 [Elysia marginata]|uniref:Uncharacterized protein n=1 Tax=Elysia marginata TaxID=1093978 RepID=A0AAV4IJS5_9GAST|nr:hypothetical protein ElyMa_004803800 [Elysia marginata]
MNDDNDENNSADNFFLQVEMFHSDEPLRDTNTLCDVAYSYNWRRRSPLALAFCVCKTPPTKPRPPRLLSQLNPVRDKKEDAKIAKENVEKKAEVTETKENSMKKELADEDIPDSLDITKKPEETEDLIKKEIKSPLKDGSQPKEPGSNTASSVLRDSAINNTDKSTPKKAQKEKIEANAKPAQQRLSSKDTKSKGKNENNKCNRPPEDIASTVSKNVKTVTNSDEKKSQSFTETSHITSSSSTSLKSDVIDVPITSSSQRFTTYASSSSSPTTITTTAAPPNKISENTKFAGSHSSPAKVSEPSINCNTPSGTLISPNQCDVKTIKSQPEAAVKTKSSKASRKVLGKRPANNPVLIAPAPAKIPPVCSSMVDISKVIKVDQNQQSLNNLSNHCGIVNANSSNIPATPTINLVSMLPVGLPTPSPSPKNVEMPKHSKASKGMKKFSSFTVANLLGSHTPKRARMRMGPSVARIKPPVLNFINTGSTNTVVSSSQSSGATNSLAPPLQTPLVPSVSGFISPLVLPQAQLYLSSNGVAPSGLRLTPTPSMQSPSQAIGVNPSALGTPSMSSSQSFVNSKVPSTPLTISFPSMGVPTTLPSLTNLSASQSAFFASTLPSVPVSQLFSSIQTSLSSPFCFPPISSSPSLVSSSSVTVSTSVTSSTASSFTSHSKSSSISSSSVTSASFITQANSFTAAAKDGCPIPPSSMSSPPPAAPASPTPAAVPIQQSQTQGADSGFSQGAHVAPKTDNNHKGSKTSKTKARANTATVQAQKTGSKSKCNASFQTNNSITDTSAENKSNIFQPGPAFAQRLSHSQETVNNSSKSSLAGKRNAATAFSADTKGEGLLTSDRKKTKLKETGLSCVPSTSIASSGTPCSNPISKSSVSPATALAQLCITSPTSQTTLTTSACKNPTSFVFPATPIHTCDKPEAKTEVEKNLANGVSDKTKTPQTPSQSYEVSNKFSNQTSPPLKTSPAIPGPISPPSRSLAVKPKKKIADIANTLHKRVSESMHTQSPGSLPLPHNRTPSSSESSSSIISTSHATPPKSTTNRVDLLGNSRSWGDGSIGGMLLPVTKPVSPSSLLTLSTSESKQRETLQGSQLSTATITSARHELPGRPLSLHNNTLAKGLSACLGSRVEAKRTATSAGALMTMRTSTPNSSPISGGPNGHLRVDEQPLNLVKRDSGFSHVASSILLGDKVKHAVK